MRNPDVLIVGVDSQIGSVLFAFFQDRGLSVLGTTRSNEINNIQKIHLDLSHVDEFELGELNVKCAIICAGITSISLCEKYPEQAFNINYLGTSSLITKLLNRNIRVIFISTDLLSSEMKSASNYSIGKLLIEKNLLSNKNTNFAIIRLGKVITKKFKLFNDWFKIGLNGGQIKAYGNIMMHPVSIQYVCDSIYKIYIDNLEGLFKIAPETGITYYNACRHLFNRRDLNLDLIKYVTCNESKILPYGKISIENYVTVKKLVSLKEFESTDALDFYIKNN